MTLTHTIEKRSENRIELLMFYKEEIHEDLYWRVIWDAKGFHLGNGTYIETWVDLKNSCTVPCPQHIIDQANREIEFVHEEMEDERISYLNVPDDLENGIFGYGY